MTDHSSEKAQPVDFDNRKCRDVFWLLLFIIFIGGMFVVSFVAYSRGDYRRVVNGMDYRGCICGTQMSYDSSTKQCTEDAAAKQLGTKSTFVKFLDSSWGNSLYIMCTPTCTSNTAQLYCADSTRDNGVLVGEGASLDDQYNYIVANAPSGSGCNNKGCSWITENCALSVKSTSQLGYCLPVDNTTFVNFANEFLGDQGWSSAWSSVNKGAWVMLGCVIFAAVISFVYMKLMECMAKPITYFALVAIFVGILLGGFFLYTQSESIKSSYTGENVDGYKDDVNWQMSFYGAIATIVVALIYLLCVCCMMKKIMMAVRCIELAGDAISDQPCILTVPALLTVLGVAIVGIWCVTAVFLYSAGEVVAAPSPSSLIPEGVYKKFTFDKTLQYAGLYHLFGLFWTTQFVMAFGEIVLAYAIVRWFFSETIGGTRQLPSKPLSTAFGAVMRHHLGSVAIGSLIIAIVKLIRAIVAYIQRRAKKGNKNKVVKFFLCICACFMCLLEKCMKFLNNQAYIQIALTGDSFCTSAQKAFWLIARNLGQIGALKIVATGFVLLGKLMIMSSSTAVCYLVLTQVSTFSDQSLDTAVPNAFIPSILVALAAFFVGSMFMSVYSQTIETILMCFIHDKEAYNGRYSDAKLRGTVEDLNSKCEDEGVAAGRAQGNAVELA